MTSSLDGREARRSFALEWLLPLGVAAGIGGAWTYVAGHTAPVNGWLLALTVAGLLFGFMQRHIAGLRRTEDARRRTEAFYRQIVETTQEGIWVWDLHGRLTYANARIAEMLGYTPQELIGRPVLELVPANKRDEVAERMARRRAGVAETYELRLQRKDGSELWTLVAANPLLDPHGHFVGGLTMLTDITAQRHAEALLREANRELTVLSDTNEVLIRATDESALLAKVCRVIVDDGGYRMAWVGMPAADGQVHVAAHAGDTDGYLETLHLVMDANVQTEHPSALALRTGYPILTPDIATDPHFAPWRAEAQARGYTASLALPLKAEGKTLGVLTVLADKPDAFDADELAMLYELTDDLAYGIAVLRTRQEQGSTERELQTIFNTVPAMIFYRDREGHIVRANRAARQLLGLSADWLIGRSIFELLPPEDAESARQQDQQIIATGDPIYDTLERLQTPHGLRWLETDKVPYRNPEGEIIGVLDFAIDVTERRKAEEALEQERALLASAIDLLPLPIFFVDTKGVIIRANTASHDFFHQADFHSLWEIQLLAADTRAPIPYEQRPSVQALHGTVVHAQECIVALPDGKQVPVLAHAAPVLVNGTLVAAVEALQDISALKAADAAKNQFLAVLTHELRTPLANVLGWVREAREEPELAPEALNVIERNAKLQHAMLEDLLDISRLLMGKFTLKRKPTDLWPLVEKCVTEIEPLLRERRLSLVLEAPLEPLILEGDAKRLAQALDVLLKNAVKFTDPGGAITIAARREGGHALLTVHDTGRGIPPELLPTLFTPFQQIERLEHVGGLGLGLMLAKGIVDLHGGQLRAESPGRDQGSTFTIELPVLEDTRG